MWINWVVFVPNQENDSLTMFIFHFCYIHKQTSAAIACYLWRVLPNRCVLCRPIGFSQNKPHVWEPDGSQWRVQVSWWWWCRITNSWTRLIVYTNYTNLPGVRTIRFHGRAQRLNKIVYWLVTVVQLMSWRAFELNTSVVLFNLQHFGTITDVEIIFNERGSKVCMSTEWFSPAY